MDREVNQVSLACGETGSVLGEAELSVEDMVGMLDSVHSKVSALKRKVREYPQRENCTTFSLLSSLSVKGDRVSG